MVRTTTLKGTPFALMGPELKVGDTAPNPLVRKSLVDDVAVLSTSIGRRRLISVVPSVDTPVCEKQTVTLTERLADAPQVAFISISTDLPPALSRFCSAKGLPADRLFVYSDHRDSAFGRAYGTLVPNLGINSRAIFIVDERDKITYVQYVPEIAEHPNYDAALAALKK